jgi:hypothetical protein
MKESSTIVKETAEEKIVINQGMNSKGLHHIEDHSLPGIKVYFMVIVLLVKIMDIKLWIAELMEKMVRAYGINCQTRNAYVAPYNIECYKCHNYGHIVRDCRKMMNTSMKENFDIRYTKVWKRKKKHVNEE